MSFNLLQDKTRQARTRAALNRELKALYAAPSEPLPEAQRALVDQLAEKLAAAHQQQPQEQPRLQPLPMTPPGL